MCSKNIAIKPIETFDSLLELSEFLNNEDACYEYIEKTMWGDEVHCPYCGMDKIYRFKSRRIFKCASCELQFSIKTGTILEHTKVPLKKWVLAMYLNGANKKGISSHQLAKEIKVTQTTAWFMLHRIRKMLEQDFSEQMEGVIMIDETYVGGKNKNRHLNKKANYGNGQGRFFPDKTPVVGLIDGSGKVRAGVVQRTDQSTLCSVVIGNVKKNSTIVTDEHTAYFQLKNFYDHQVVNHGKLQYKSNQGYSTNRIEGFWASVKRTILGVYHNVSPKHLHRYIDEIVFRHNTKDMRQGERFNKMLSQIKTRLTYNQLVYGT
jgi:transposase-like protein